MLVYLNYNTGITKQSNNWKHGQFNINTYNLAEIQDKILETFTFNN
jgi:hypothetical protein